MRYWDSSALIPLLLEEPGSTGMMAALEDDPFVLTSAYATVEITSALWRRRHDGQMTLEVHQSADRVLADLAQTWVELKVSQTIINLAVDVLSRHRLRAGDALQLATAIDSAHANLTFVTLDEDLAAAARAEGFPVLP